MTVPLLTMEDHSQAYFAWKRAGIRSAWCWHLDAHLDIGRDGLGPTALARLESADTCPPELCGNPYVPWGGLHCGNYLYAAIHHGQVGRLSWVIPPDLVRGPLLAWGRTHLNGWLDLSVSESDGLSDRGGWLEGTLLGIPFQVGTAEALPAPDQPVLLDVDLDYFLDQQGQVWQEPGPIFPESCYTTVAYSVLGGYTPTRERRLAAYWTPDWKEGYQASLLDEAAGLVRLRQHQQALKCLHDRRDVAGEYLRGTCQHHLGQFEEALSTWKRLLPQVPTEGRAYLAGLISELFSTRLHQPQQALFYARQGLQEVEDYRLLYAAAVALEQLEQLRQSTQMLRRGLKLAEGTVIGQHMRRLLARLYQKQGKDGLAKLELAQIHSSAGCSSVK